MPAVPRELTSFQPIRLLIVIGQFAGWATFIAVDNSDRDADAVSLNCPDRRIPFTGKNGQRLGRFTRVSRYPMARQTLLGYSAVMLVFSVSINSHRSARTLTRMLNDIARDPAKARPSFSIGISEAPLRLTLKARVKLAICQINRVNVSLLRFRVRIQIIALSRN
jgi:hypothetical protein